MAVRFLWLTKRQPRTHRIRPKDDLMADGEEIILDLGIGLAKERFL